MSSKKSKKKHSKKQQFKYAAPVGNSSGSTPAASTPAAPLSKASIGTPAVPARVEVPGLSLIRHDVRRVVVLAGSFVAVELILWYLFGHTSLGPTIYRLIKL